MYEVEAKVRLSEDEYKRLEKQIPILAKKGQDVRIKDRYYSVPKQFSLRLRERNDKKILNIKYKKRGQGIEFNNEIELPIKSVNDIDKFFASIGIHITAKKTKIGKIYKYGQFQIELNFIKSLGYFLEIETIVDSKSKIISAKKALRELFGKLGFKPSQFENKYYLELLDEIRKNK